MFFIKNKIRVAIYEKVEYLIYRHCIQVFRTKVFQKGLFLEHFFMNEEESYERKI